MAADHVGQAPVEPHCRHPKCTVCPPELCQEVEQRRPPRQCAAVAVEAPLNRSIFRRHPLVQQSGYRRRIWRPAGLGACQIDLVALVHGLPHVRQQCVQLFVRAGSPPARPGPPPQPGHDQRRADENQRAGRGYIDRFRPEGHGGGRKMKGAGSNRNQPCHLRTFPPL